MDTLSRKAPNCDEYTIGWIAVLSIELAAAKAILDEEYDAPSDLEQSIHDTNFYTFGRIHRHHVVVVSLPAGDYGTVSALASSLPIFESFVNINFGLLVGVGAGVPSKTRDIRLGDIAISQPTDASGGVIQHDFVKARSHGSLQRIGHLSKPPQVLLKSLNILLSEHELGRSRIPEYLSQAIKANPKLAETYAHPGIDDRLFESSYIHQAGNDERDCSNCAVAGEIQRRQRISPTEPVAHAGLIASGNCLIRDARVRDQIAATEPDCLCLEMEAAGLMNHFPCLVVRGISDYADSHKNDIWRRYASLTAAACGKEVLLHTTPVPVARTRTSASIRELSLAIHTSNQNRTEDRISAFLSALDESGGGFARAKDRNPARSPNTCQWFVGHEHFKNWQHQPSAQMLWVSADPGCGKSVLCKYLIDSVLSDMLLQTQSSGPSPRLCYFFFKDDFPDQRSSCNALASILLQLFEENRTLISESILKTYSQRQSTFCASFATLWSTLLSVLKQNDIGPVICVLDALDECQEESRHELIRVLRKLPSAGDSGVKIKFLITSRPYQDLASGFRNLASFMSVIHLAGEGDAETEQISREIDLVIREKVDEISAQKKLQAEQAEILYRHFTRNPNRTYLWVHLALTDIKQLHTFDWSDINSALSEVGTSTDAVYERMLSRSPDHDRAMKIFQIIIAALRPLSPIEVVTSLKLARDRDLQEHMSGVQPSEADLWTTIKELCGLLVIMTGSRIYLIHQTAKEFLIRDAEPVDNESQPRPAIDNTLQSRDSAPADLGVWKQSIIASSAHLQMAEICARFLQLQDPHVETKSLSTYCRIYLCAHLGQTSVQIQASIVATTLHLLNTELKPFWFQILSRMPGRGSFSFKWFSEISSLSGFVVCLGVLPLVQRLLADGKLAPYRKEEGGFSALHWAVLTRSESMTRTLVEWRAPIGYQTLSIAAQFVRQPLKTVASLTTSGETKPSALYYAISYGRYDLAKLLLERGAKSVSYAHKTPLHFAISLDRPDLMRLLLDHGANANRASWVGIGHRFGWGSFRDDNTFISPLHLAIAKGSLGMVEILLRYAANVEQLRHAEELYYDPRGTTPLMKATQEGLHEICGKLIEYGADPNDASSFYAPSFATRIPFLLNLAISNLDYRTVKVLVECGAQFPAECLQGSPGRKMRKRLTRLRKSPGITLPTSGVPIESSDTVIIRLFLLYAGIKPNQLDSFSELYMIIRNMLSRHEVNPIANNIWIAWRHLSWDKYYGRRLLTLEETSLLHQAILGKEWILAQRLIAAGIECDLPAFLSVLQIERKEMLRQILINNTDQMGFVFTSAGQRHHFEKSFTEELYGGLNFALRTFIRAGLPDRVALMLDEGASINEKDQKGRTALSLAMTYGYTDGRNNISAVELEAYEKDYREIAGILLSRGADRYITDNSNQSPINRGLAFGNRWCESILQRHEDPPELDQHQDRAAVYGPEFDALQDAYGLSPVQRRLKRAGHRIKQHIGSYPPS